MFSDSQHGLIVSWLSTIDFDSNHLQATKLAHPGTGQWFIESETFKDWLCGIPSTRFLWLYGLRKSVEIVHRVQCVYLLHQLIVPSWSWENCLDVR